MYFPIFTLTICLAPHSVSLTEAGFLVMWQC